VALLSESDAQRIEALVDAVESHTSAEIVVIEAAACGAWAAQRAWLAGGALLLGSFALHFACPALPATWLLVLQAVLAPLAWWGAGHPRALSHVIPVDAAAAAVDARARQLFAERGLYGTRARTGILILISDLERRVSILADTGVSAQLDPDEWRRDVEAITDAIRSGRAAAGIAGVVEQLGEKLAVALPRADEDADEISDAVLRVD
jgi:putative membrane protein